MLARLRAVREAMNHQTAHHSGVRGVVKRSRVISKCFIGFRDQGLGFTCTCRGLGAVASTAKALEKLLQRNVLSGITRCTFRMAEVHTSVKSDLKKDLLRSKKDPIIGIPERYGGRLGCLHAPPS